MTEETIANNQATKVPEKTEEKKIVSFLASYCRSVYEVNMSMGTELIRLNFPPPNSKNDK